MRQNRNWKSNTFPIDFRPYLRLFRVLEDVVDILHSTQQTIQNDNPFPEQLSAYMGCGDLPYLLPAVGSFWNQNLSSCFPPKWYRSLPTNATIEIKLSG